MGSLNFSRSRVPHFKNRSFSLRLMGFFLLKFIQLEVLRHSVVGA